MTDFRVPQYVEVGAPLVKQLCGHVDCGESFVLLGPEGSGKRHLLRLIRKALEKQCSKHLSVVFRSLRPVTNTEELIQTLLNQRRAKGTVADELREQDRRHPMRSLDDWFGALKNIAMEQGCSVPVAFANVDALADSLASEVLKRLRNLVENKYVTAAITGEDHLASFFVWGDTPLSWAQPYVVQGHDRETMHDYFRKRCELTQLKFWNDEEAFDHFWHWVGGNTNHLGLLLYCLSEHRISNGQIDIDHMFTKEEIPEQFDDVWGIPNQGIRPFHRSICIVEAHGDAQKKLEDLMSQWQKKPRLQGDEWSQPQWRIDGAIPSSLELSGLAVRDHEGMIHFASRYAAEFVHTYFTDVRLGDFHARRHEWEEAARHYSVIERSVRAIRPFDRAGLLRLEQIVDGVCRDMHQAAMKQDFQFVENVCELFRRACQDLLGHGQVTFLRKDGTYSEWKPQTSGKSLLEVSDILADIQRRSPLHSTDEATRFFDEETHCFFGFTEDPKLGHSAIVLISDLEEHLPMPPDRKKLTLRLMEHFMSAWSHAVRGHAVEGRLYRLEDMMRATATLLESIGDEVLDTHGVLAKATELLLVRGYRRAAWFLHRVDLSQHEAVESLCLIHEGVPDHKLPRHITDLAMPVVGEQHIQQVFAERKARIIPAKEWWAPVNAEPPPRDWSGDDMLIAPIFLKKHTQALGVLVVEASRGTFDETDPALAGFLTQIAVALRQAERTAWLLGTLNHLDSPVAIIDARQRIRFANGKACEVFGGRQAGWQNEEPTMSLERFSALEPFIRAVKGQREARQSQGQKLHPLYQLLSDKKNHPWALELQALKDRDGRYAATSIFLHDRDLAHRVWRIVTDFIQTRTVDQSLETLAESLSRDLGIPKIRLYLMNEGVLESRKSFGFSSPEKRKYFDSGGVRLEGNYDSSNNKAIATRRPQAFLWLPEGNPNPSSTHDIGLAYELLRSRPLWDQLEAKPGDYWIDFPLYNGDVPIGKLTLAYDSDAQPKKEHLGLLEPLCEVFAWRLNMIAKTEQEKDEVRKDKMLELQDRTVAEMAHALLTRVVFLPNMVPFYRGFEYLVPQLKKGNDKLEACAMAAVETMERFKNRLAEIYIDYAKVDLLEVLNGALEYVRAGGGKASFDCGELEHLYIEGDRVHLNDAFAELVHNSSVFVRPGFPLSVTIRVRIEPGNDIVHIWYDDNGRGIEPTRREWIFGRFNSNRPGISVKGTGVGLHYVRAVFNKHGGDIRVVKQDPPGASFIMTIPTAKITQTSK